MFGSIVSDGGQSVAAKQMVLRPYNSARVQAASLAADPAGSVGMISVGRSSSLPLSGEGAGFVLPYHQAMAGLTG